MAYTKYLTTEYPNIFFEDNKVGRLKKRIWDASEEEIQAILDDYGIGTPLEMGVAGTYIQNTPRAKLIEKRRQNDIVLVPIGSTENHGAQNCSGLDTFMVQFICEAVRRKTKKLGHEVSLAFPPMNYGGHPYHHIGMPGTVMISETVIIDTLTQVMAGLWDDGFRKIILVNNHGQDWMLGDERPDFVTTPFVHADESETSAALLMFPEMVDMSVCVDATPKNFGFLQEGFFDGSVDSFHRPNRWQEMEGNAWIERFGTPEGVVGKPTRADPRRVKRAIAAICEYLTCMCEDIIEKYPAGKVPDPSKFSFRPAEEIEPCLREPLSEGWKSIHELPRRGMFID